MWKRKIQAALSISNLGAWTGLLVDFENAATRIGAMLPVLDALLPIVALAGTAGGIVWVTFEVWEWTSPRLPGQRLKAHAPLIEQLRTVSGEALSDATKLHHTFGLILEAKQILEDEFSIPCPGMPETESHEEEVALSNWLSDWGAFASILLPRVRQGNLKTARMTIDNLDMKLAPMASWVTEGTNKPSGARSRLS